MTTKHTVICRVLLRVLLAACLPVFADAFGQLTPNQQKYVVDAVRIEGDIALTGRLDDPRWKAAPVVECPFEIEPGENAPARQRTQVRLLYSAKALYVGFVCFDTGPSAIRAHVADRDN